MKPIKDCKQQEQDYRKKIQPVMSVTGLNDQGLNYKILPTFRSKSQLENVVLAVQKTIFAPSQVVSFGVNSTRAKSSQKECRYGVTTNSTPSF